MVLELISETRAKVNSRKISTGAATAASALTYTGTIVEVGEVFKFNYHVLKSLELFTRA